MSFLKAENHEKYPFRLALTRSRERISLNCTAERMLILPLLHEIKIQNILSAGS